MSSRNPLFHRCSRLNELQVVDMALSELEQNIKKPDPHKMIHRVGSAMYQKLNQIKTASEVCKDISRRALLSSPTKGYSCVTDMILDLRRIRPQVEYEQNQKIAEEQKQKELKQQKKSEKISFSERVFKPLTVTFFVLFGIGLAFGIGTALHYLYPNGIFLTPVEVPSLIGENMEEISPDSDLFSLNVTYQFHSDAETGTILSQSPKAGMTRHISPGKHPCTLSLLVSLGPEQVQVGDYAGMTKYQAMNECRRLGLIPILKQVKNHPYGNVSKTDPPAGSVIKQGSSITLYVGNAAYIGQVAVPNLVDNSEVGASTMLSSLGLIRGNVSYMSSDRPVGTVIAQSILSGTSVGVGTKVSIVVSKGRS